MNIQKEHHDIVQTYFMHVECMYNIPDKNVTIAESRREVVEAAAMVVVVLVVCPLSTSNASQYAALKGQSRSTVDAQPR